MITTSVFFFSTRKWSIIVLLALCYYVGVDGFMSMPVHTMRRHKLLQRYEQGTQSVENSIDQERNGLKDPPSISRQDSTSWDAVSRQLSTFRSLAYPYFEESKGGRWLLGGLLALTLLNSGVSVAFSYLSKDFWNALSAKDPGDFYFVLQKYVAALAVGAPVATFYRFQRQSLAIHWREWMTARTFQLYSNNRVYYNLDKDIDNPDQRMTEDVQAFTAFSLQLVITLLTSLIDLVSFSTILWSIYPQLFTAILVYAGAGTAITTVLGKPLVHLNVKQLRQEADLRYSLVRLRDNAESIAFYAGEDLEGQAVEQRLERVTSNRRQIIKAQRKLEFFTTSYRYLVQIVPVAVVAPKYFGGEIALGVISQSVGAFNHILSDLSIIVNQFEQLSSFSAGIERLETLYAAIQAADPDKTSFTDDRSNVLTLSNRTSIETSVNDMSFLKNSDSLNEAPFGKIQLQTFKDQTTSVLEVSGFDLCTPDKKRALIKGLNFKLKAGDHLLIVGDSGAGKSSLLRAIAGLWTSGNGSIRRPSDENVYFLPQRPYCTLGTMKDQLLYPSLENNFGNVSSSENKMIPRSHLLKESLSDEDLLDILDKVYLMDIATNAGDGDAIKGLHAHLDWSNRLSLGEQQRLAFGRILVNQPELVILDEATSALDTASEARMYNLLQNMARRNIHSDVGLSTSGFTFVSVGHRPTLVGFHNKRLSICAGECAVSDIEKSNSPMQLR